MSVTGRPGASMLQDMSWIQETEAIILCLELGLSCAMRVHEVVPYDKKMRGSFCLGRSSPFLCPDVILSSFGPESPAQMTKGMWEVEP